MRDGQQFAERLRAVADWYDAHPGVPVPYLPSLNAFIVEGRDEFAVVAKRLGHAEKGIAGDLFYLRVTIAGLNLDFNIGRTEVCEARVVGTREIPARAAYHLPATEARTEDVIEWECRSILEPEPAPEPSSVGQAS